MPGPYFIRLEVKDNKGCEKSNDHMLIVKDTAQKGEIDYMISDCSKNGEFPCASGLHFQICRDTLRAYRTTRGNCCTKKLLQ